MTTSLPTAPAFNHIGITVPDLDAAVDWYSTVLQFTVLGGPMQVDKQDEPFGEVLGDIFGSDWGSLRVAFLATADGTGMELFEFLAPATVRPDEVEYWRTGPFHVCLTWPDVASLARHIADNGGKQRSKVWTLFPGREVVYCEDPFGTILEISSGTFDQTWANRTAGETE
ncbi:VOC family protein [Rhodococcus sp. NPDC056960]|uniref:VOC family protein n=1 Tax=Rhodococcus sp. NPDC056960 TaxID=3345982 RepID=UPI00362EE56B